MDPVKRVVVSLRGERDYPLADVKIPEAQCSDFPAMLASARRVHPDASEDDVVRAIWRHGTKYFRDAMANPMRAQGFLRNLPGPQKEVVPGGPSGAASNRNATGGSRAGTPVLSDGREGAGAEPDPGAGSGAGAGT